ncbi:MAG: chorismate-binding protein [Novosphingobium sp.]|nr:chorismate-binding protein [Novosphingobium sp.]
MTVLTDACAAFARQGQGEDCGQYIFQIPRQGRAFVGIGVHRTVSCQEGTFTICDESGQRTIACTDNPLQQAGTLLEPDRPSFWMVGPDLARSVSDPALPLIYCVQPKVEIEIAGDANDLETASELTAEPAEGWTTQDDATFTRRLESAIATLSDYPDGKMIITRSYRRTCAGRDPFELFRIFAASEPSAACNHFARIGENAISLGCSPENVFEVRDGKLIFDVVAATRGKSADPETDARWKEALRTDAKEQREHIMAFERYRQRIETLIQPNSLEIDFQMKVLELGNVRHLYSRASGTLREDLDWQTILSDSFPALISYPPALQSIADPQQEPLRYYGGIVGRVGGGMRDAAFFLNLRAALTLNDVLHTQGGVGVIRESEPAKELLEVRNKLSGLFKAIAAWENLETTQPRA